MGTGVTASATATAVAAAASAAATTAPRAEKAGERENRLCSSQQPRKHTYTRSSM